jgi:soluble lytic murein transglycosylase-like protein
VSIDVAVARVSELRTMLGIAPPPAAPPATAATAPGAAPFGAQLAGAMSPTGGTAAPAGASPFQAEIDAAAQRNGIDPRLLRSVIRAESNFDPNATSPAGAQGLTQLMPGTAASLGVTNPLDPAQSIEGGAKYLRRQLDAFGGDVSKALAAYNAGPGAVTKFGGVPPYAETQNYVQKILGYMNGQS